MRAGQLRHRLIVQTKSSTGDGMGGVTESWTDDHEIWGAVWPITGKEYVAMQQVNSDVTTRIRIRYQSGVTPANRLRLGDTTTYYDIKSVINSEMRNIYLDLMCRESM